MKLRIVVAGLGLALVASAVSAEEARPENKAERHVWLMDHGKPDTNGDGEITRDEFLAMHSTMFDRLDADKDGKISKAEREAGHMRIANHGEHAMVGPGPGGPGGPGEHRMRVIELHHDGHGPGELDADKDGKISLEEFAVPMQQAFEAMDADKSGFLEEGERARGPMRFERRVEKVETK